MSSSTRFQHLPAYQKRKEMYNADAAKQAYRALSFSDRKNIRKFTRILDESNRKSHEFSTAEYVVDDLEGIAHYFSHMGYDVQIIPDSTSTTVLLISW